MGKVVITRITQGRIVFAFGESIYEMGGEANQGPGREFPDYSVFTSSLVRADTFTKISLSPAEKTEVLSGLEDEFKERGITVELLP